MNSASILNLKKKKKSVFESKEIHSWNTLETPALPL